MLIPISWLKDFVDIKLPLKDLMWKMTEAGLTCESYKEVDGDKVLDVEVTANRPDWMSIIGVAREVAAIQGIKIKEIRNKPIPKPANHLAIKLLTNFELLERWTGIIIKDVKIAPSPKWLSDRIRLMGHEPINNVIDITNYVMYELGIPMHAFDYDEIKGSVMKVTKSRGGEDFVSVDGLAYKLPKDAIVIYDAERLIDLAGIKGGLNSGIKPETKNIFLHVTINNPVLVRRASIALGLRSEASAIYERGPDKGGVINSLTRAVNLILENAGGKVASEIIDLKKQEVRSWKLEVGLAKLEKVLGIKIPAGQAVKILDQLNLSPEIKSNKIICTIPTYRGDLKIEEDLIEEIARIYGYNKFPKTLPKTAVNTRKIPYYFDDSPHQNLRKILLAAGYSEAMNLSLISTSLIEKCLLNPKDHIALENPVSLDYEHLRTSLLPSLLLGIKLNQNENQKVKIFEIDKVYPSESYKASAAAQGIAFRELKGVIDLILAKLNIENYQIEFEADKQIWHPAKSATIWKEKEKIGCFGAINPQVLDNLALKNEVFAFEFDVATLNKHTKRSVFKPIPEFPPQIEDLTLTFPPKTRIGDVISLITDHWPQVTKVGLKDIYKDAYTFRLYYQHPQKTLTDTEVAQIRSQILAKIKSKFGGILK